MSNFDEIDSNKKKSRESTGMMAMIRAEFTPGRVMTLTEVYEAVAVRMERENSKEFQHSVRGAIRTLKKNNTINHIGEAKYSAWD